jgi:hypothetical protein
MLLVVAKEVAARKEEAAWKAGKDPHKKTGPRGEGPAHLCTKDPHKKAGKLEEEELEERERGADAPPVAAAASPPSPNASRKEEAAAARDGETVPPATRGRGRAADATTDPEVLAAVAAYNEAAGRHRWTQCRTLTQALARRLQTQLNEIGGLDAFKLALKAIPRDDWLMGRVAPKDDRKPFRLDLQALLQTGGKRGDELVRLLDLAHEAELINGAAAVSDPDAIRRAVEANPCVAQHLSNAALEKAFEHVPEPDRPPQVRDRLAQGGRQ